MINFAACDVKGCLITEKTYVYLWNFVSCPYTGKDSIG